MQIVTVVALAPFWGLFPEAPLTSDKVFIGKPEAISNEVPEAENMKLRTAKRELMKSAELTARLGEEIPGARLVKRDDGVYCSNGLASLALEASDELSGLVQIRYRLNDGAWEEYRGAVRVRDEGRYWLKWESADRVGNREKQQSIRLYVDKTAPLITVGPQGNYAMLKSTVVAHPGFKLSIEAKDESCGLKTIYVDSGTGWRKLEGESLELGNPGKFTVRVMADDILDNRSEVRALNLLIDDDAPVVKLHPSKPLYKEGNELVCRPDTDLLIAASDRDSEVQRIEIRRATDASWTVLHTSKIEIRQPGEFYLEARAVDIAGNITKDPVIFRCKSPAAPPKSILTPKDDKR